MRKRISVLLSLLLIGSFILMPSSATAQTAPSSEQPPTVELFSHAPRTHLQVVPEEIRAAFEGGMSAEEFVERTGRVPHALEDFVEGKKAAMVIELEQAPLAVHVADLRAQGQLDIQASSKVAYVDNLKRIQRDVQSRLLAIDESITIISRYTAAYNGLLAEVPLDRLDEIRALPEVKAIHRAPEHKPALGSSVPLIGAQQVWEDLGYRGEDTTIAVIDSGIDYNHAALGGSGDASDYEGNDPDIIEAGTFPTAKVIGGWDFAGTNYDASGSSGSTTPSPDPDPLDEMGHGTHVASIAAGIKAGSVMTGVAPAANLMALKVFGKSGSTLLTMDAIDWATAHYIMHGSPDVINMSLGSNYGPADPNDPDVRATDNAATAGIVVVSSAGNAGDTSYIVGSPATADEAIAVAASTTGYATGPTINISGTEAITLTDIIYTPSSFDNDTGHFTQTVTAPLFALATESVTATTLCTTEGVTADLTGKVALIQRGGCNFSVKVNNAAALGAEAAIIYNNVAGALGMIGVPVEIPACSILLEQGLNLVTAHDETVVISAEDDVTTAPSPTPPDTAATFTSRGPRGFDSMLKPDVTAPGVAIFAADMGSGTEGVSMNGTSMASPHVAGVAALMKQAHPTWTPEHIKAAMMNTAVDLVSGFQIPRQGAGRVEAGKAITTPVVAIADEDLVSANWGFAITSHDEKVLTKDVTLWNWDTKPHTFTVDAALQMGTMTETASITEAVTVEASEDMVIVPGNAMSATVGVTLTVDATQFPFDFWALEEVYGFVSFDNETVAGHRLRVPFYVIPRPYSKLEVTSSNTTAENPAVGMVQATIQHSGPITSSLWAYPAMLHDPNEAAQLDHGDVRLLGMDYAGADPDYGDIAAIAINSYGPWHTPQPYFAEFDLYLDVNEDGISDFVNFNFNYGWFGGGDDTDKWIVVQVELATGTIYLASPYLIYTDYTANVMEWLLPAAWNGLLGGDTTFDYQLVGWDYVGNQDLTKPGSFDYSRSPLMGGATGLPGPANPTVVMMAAIADLGGYMYSKPAGAMLIDYNGDPRGAATGRYQALFFPGPVPAQIYMPVIMKGG
jgi:subtilisin family serine protease